MSTQAVRRSAGGDLIEQAVKRARMMQEGESPSPIKKEEIEEVNESVTESPLDALVRSQVESLAGSDTSDSKEDLIKDEPDFSSIFQNLGQKMDLDFSPLTPSSGPYDVSSFTVDTTFGLIECVKALPALWDPASGASQRTKKDTWSLVADKMSERGYTVDARLCCSKFRILRDSYMRIIRKSAAKGASASEKGKSWQFFEPLKFLGDGNGGAIPGEDRSSSSPLSETNDQIEVAQKSYNDILLSAVHMETAVLEEKERKKAEKEKADAAVIAAALAAVAASSSKAKEAPTSIVAPEIRPSQSIHPLVKPKSLSTAPIITKTVTPSNGNKQPSTVGGTLRIVDTWSSFGDHVADMLREMSRLEEDETWETRMAIEKMLVARNEQLREKAKKKE
ncbi:hypothetical protein PRIPAC_79445 [Pristionchus pacificus]|uniref:Myb/SANT-like transcription factor n=1 Tax=Pristionchus pacificus TaxID=54126 RepID=A0A2A6C3L1_PRIPA|nr:hypothetical protein PRIPAC_79445 [Pristionchus pacificus]|eukprot:PDM72720.1 Myb/SANT-like transcription factor [Pristionchus pacificus]